MAQTKAQEQTLAIIKPDAVGANEIGSIMEYMESEGLKIIATMMVHLTEDDAKRFYLVHKDRPFYKDLVQFMASGPVVALVLEGENAVLSYRNIMGATDPEKAEKGTIRGDLAHSIDKNAVHGSDSLENAKIEIEFFTKLGMKICPRN